MIGAIGDQAAMATRGGSAEQGRRAEAVGQQAKAAVAAAREAGAELPKNAQGLAASGIARGAEPASIFAALVSPVGEPDSTGDVGGVPTTPTDDGSGAPVGGDVVVDGEGAPPAPIAPPPADLVAEDETPADDAPVQVVVSQPALSVDDGAVAVELLAAADA